MDRYSISKISLIILSWNGKPLLEKNLPSVIKAVKNCELTCEIIVVDNGSNDGTSDFLENNYPRIMTVKLDANKRFTGGNNAGAAAASGDILIFLNNDVEVQPDFIPPLLEHFTATDIFAVGCNILMRGVRKESGLTRGYFRKVFLEVEHSWEEFDKAVPILYASGAAFACDKDKFRELGGFDTLWDPFYWEDTDLCYRAWKRGWRVIFEPRSIVYHMHQATNNYNNFSRIFLNLPKEANKYLFIWKNISNPWYLFRHFTLLPFVLAVRLIKFQFIKFLAFFLALKKLPKAIYSGIIDEKKRKFSDAEILKITSDIFYYKKLYHLTRVNKDTLKILYICAYLPSLGISAGFTRMFEIIKRLGRKHQVDVISFIVEEEFKYLPMLKEICNRVDIVKRDYSWTKDYLLTIPAMIDEFYSKDIETLIKRRIYEEDYDIVQFEYLHMSQYAPPSYSGKLVLTEHQLHFAARKRDFYNLSPSFKKIESLFSYWKGMIYEIRACRKFDKIITLTEHEKQILKSYIPSLNIEVVPMGVDIKLFRPNDKTEEKTDIVYLGFFRHYPNVDAVRYFYNFIYPLIKKEIPQVKFNIIGFDPPEEISEMHKLDGITVTGNVKDVRPYLEDAKVFIMPIRLGMGMRGKLFEAWAMKKAVVSTSIGCEGVAVEDGKDIFIADEPGVFAQKTMELIKNKEKRRTLGTNARKKAELKYNWDILSEKIDSIYKNLL